MTVLSVCWVDQAYEGNTNYVALHALWRVLMYCCALGLLVAGGGGRGNGEAGARGGKEEESGLLASAKLI